MSTKNQYREHIFHIMHLPGYQSGVNKRKSMQQLYLDTLIINHFNHVLHLIIYVSKNKKIFHFDKIIRNS